MSPKAASSREARIAWPLLQVRQASTWLEITGPSGNRGPFPFPGTWSGGELGSVVPHEYLHDLGLAVLRTGWLKELRTSLGISRRQLAEMMNVSVQTAKRWEEGGNRSVWADSTRRVGQFYTDAIMELQKVHDLGEKFKDYVPASVAASPLALPTPTIEKMCEAGELECLNLGVLGVYVKHPRLVSSAGSK